MTERYLYELFNTLETLYPDPLHKSLHLRRNTENIYEVSVEVAADIDFELSRLVHEVNDTTFIRNVTHKMWPQKRIISSTWGHGIALHVTRDLKRVQTRDAIPYYSLGKADPVDHRVCTWSTNKNEVLISIHVQRPTILPILFRELDGISLVRVCVKLHRKSRGSRLWNI